MKRTITLLSLVIAIGALPSCNAFDFVDPDLDSLDRCKSMNDSGDYAGAIEACMEADPTGTNVDAQLELADARLAVLGINIKSLSKIFLQQGSSTNTIIDLAEVVIAEGRIGRDNAVQSKKYAEEAVAAFDNYGALLGNTLEERQVAVFYSLLGRVCRVAILMAYADIDSSHPDGRVTRADICNPDQPTCATTSVTICTGTACNGMNRTDAGTAADTLIGLVDLINTPPSEGGLPSNLNIGAISDMTGILVDDPVSHTLTPIQDFMLSTYKPDAGRRILLEIARAN